MKLSIVVSGRNDNHCGDFIYRMNCSLATLPEDAEIIMVEWNPPEDAAPLASTIKRPGVRVITVPREAHNSMHGWDAFPFFEYRAKNVGIRRATGDWILSMNPDIYFGIEMQERLGQRLDSIFFYQAPRHDIDGGKLVQICNGPGDFLLMHREKWFDLRGYLDLVSYSHLDSLLAWNAEFCGIEKVVLPCPVFHQEHDRSIHKGRMTIHSSDIHRFIGQKNAGNWGLADMQLPETVT